MLFNHNIMSWPTLLVLSTSYLSNAVAVRTCENFAEYFNPFSRKCSDNPDAGAKPIDILRRWGCQASEYNVTTRDGYQILVVRVHGNDTSDSIPIVMGHGIYMNCLGFISMSQKTLANNLCRNGQDVFLLNFRGTLFSRGHTNLTDSDKAYWNYSFHEMGIYDIPSVLESVVQITGKPKSIYIGYSMGTTAMTVYTTLYPQEASERLAGLIYLAPVMNVSHIRSFVKYLVPFWRFPIKPLAELIGNGILLPNNALSNRFCASGTIPIYLCYSIRSVLFGPDFEGLDPYFRPVTFINNPDRIPINLIEHYYQCYVDGRFHEYDYGSQDNLRLYGRETPPDYPIGNISIPTSFFVSDNDWVAEKHNAVGTYNQIPSQYQCGYTISENEKFGHDDFITSRYQMRDLNQAVFHEMGAYDIPSVLDSVVRITGKPKSIYIGYSMGTTAMTVYTTLYPQEASDRLAGLIYLAPVMNVSDIRSFVKYLVPFWHFPIKPLAESIGAGIPLPIYDAIYRFCASGTIPIYLCYFLKSLSVGPDFKSLDPVFRPVLNMNIHEVIPTNLVEHFYQCYIDERFHEYDYGSHRNLILYGRESPPDYPICDISIPVTFFVSDNDWIAETNNALQTYNQIPSQYQCGFIVLDNKDYSHDDFVTSRYQMRDLNNAVLDKLHRMQSNSC